MDVNSRFKVKNNQNVNVDGVDVVVRRNGVHKCCPQPVWERNKTCLTALAAIGSTVITQQIMTALSSGFNSIGFGASDQVKTIELSWSSSVLHLETTSGMFKVFKVIQNVCFFPNAVSVSLWASAGWGCVRSTLRLRPQLFATIRNRSQPSATVRKRQQPSARSLYGRAYGKFCKRGHFWRFHMWRCFVSPSRHGTSWHLDVFGNVS